MATEGLSHMQSPVPDDFLTSFSDMATEGLSHMQSPVPDDFLTSFSDMATERAIETSRLTSPEVGEGFSKMEEVISPSNITVEPHGGSIPMGTDKIILKPLDGDKCETREKEEEKEELLGIHEPNGVTSECLLSNERVTGIPKDEEKCKDDKEERLPDGGWGWVVVFGAALILVLVDTIGQCFGMIFSRFLLDLETPTATTAWIFNLFSFVWCVTGSPLGPLIEEFGWRTLTFIGSLILAVATISSAFASAAWILFFTYSILGGIGCGIICTIGYIIVPHYFNKRRGFANGIIMAFDCGGQLIGPPLIEILQDEYTFTGATLILGGVILNCCVGALVFHPVEWHLKPREGQSLMDREVSRLNKSSADHTRLVESRWKILVRIAHSTVKNLTILKSFRGFIISVSCTLIFCGYLNFLAIVPFAMQETGRSLGEAAACVSVSALCNMMTRVVVASLSDSKWFNFQISMLIGVLTISGTMFCFPFIENLTALKVIMGLWGFGVGNFMSIYNLVMVHYMGLDNLMTMMGASMLCIAFGYLIIGPFAGYVRDITQSYSVCIWVLSGAVFIAFLLWLCMPAAVAYDLEREEKRKATNKKETEEEGISQNSHP